MNPNIKKVKISELNTPKNGLFDIHIDHYWIVTKDDEVLIYRDFSPQCNMSETLTTKLRDKIYPDCDVKQIPVIYLPYKD
jgi:hypothetical protein